MICTVFTDRTRCTETATAFLIQPDGKRNPGSRVCPRHGEAITVEYQEKLGESWGLEPIPLEENPE